MARIPQALTKPTVVIGLLGTTLDAGRGATRWEKWRPTVSLCQHEDLLVHRLELLYSPGSADLMRHIRDDIHHVSPETEVRLHELALKDPWDFEEVYGALHDFARGYPFDPEHEDYLVHITTGTHVAQICLFLLTESRATSRRACCRPRRRASRRPGARAASRIIDLDLSKYDRIASRFDAGARDGPVVPEVRHRRPATPAFNRADRADRAGGDRARAAPILLIGPTGRRQVAARAAHLRAQEGPAPGRRRRSSRSTAPRCAATRRCRRCSAT